jgi:FkbM family methyltransferase
VLGSRGTRALYRSPVASPLRRLLSSSAPERPHLVEVCGGALQGAQMYVDLSCEKYYWLGTHEEPVQRALLSYARPAAVAYDVGAHVGFFSLLLSQAVGTGGRVLSFEPLAENAERLQSNIDANPWAANVRVHAVALGDLVGWERFSVHGSSLEGSLAQPCSDGNVVVPATTIDALAAAGAPPPDVMKIDVEGAEGRVLRGGRRIIEAHRPAIVLEIHSQEAWGDVLDALPASYVCAGIGGAGDVTLRQPGHYIALPAERAREE